MAYHVPVLLDEVVQELVSDPDGVYLDATAGGGGHSGALLKSLSCRGMLWAVDRDSDAVDEVRSSLGGDRRPGCGHVAVAGESIRGIGEAR